MRKIMTMTGLMICTMLFSQPRTGSTGSSCSYSGESIGKYPSLDITNSFTGLPGLWVTENSGATGVRFQSPNTTLQMRAFSSPVFIIDGMLVEDITEVQLSPEDIESITLIPDIVDKVKYGPEAARGAVFITTLRGIESGRQVRVGFEKGVDAIDRLPQWCDGVEYAELNNIARSNYNARIGSEVYPNLYSEEDIQAYGKRDMYDMFHPNVDYQSLMLKNIRDYNKAFVSIRGGGNGTRYSANLDYAGQGDVLKVGAASNFNRFGAKMNVDVDITQKLSFNFSFFGTYSIRKSPISGYGAYSNVYEFPTILSRIQLTPPIEYPIDININDGEGITHAYLISQNYPDHPYGTLANSGSYSEVLRAGITRAQLSYDLSSLLKGLKAEGMVGYNVAYLARYGQGADFLGYLYDKDLDTFEPTSHTGESASSQSTYLTDYIQALQFSADLDYDRTFGDHSVKATLSHYISNQSLSSTSVLHKQQNTALAGSYSYAGRYLVEAAFNYAGSSALKSGHRFRMFPSVGLGWVVSNENFMNGSRAFNYLKLHAQTGCLGYESFSNQYLWESHYQKSGAMSFGPSSNSTNTWLGSTRYSTTATTASSLSNPDLGWEVCKELSIGLDATLFNHLSVGYTYFRCFRDGIVTDISSVLPLFYGGSSVYDNYNQIFYWGHEAKLAWSGARGDFRYSLGGSFIYNGDKYVTLLEATSLEPKEGHGLGEFYGFDYLGVFSSEEEIASSPVQNLGSEVCVGDLKYRDVTGDNVVDANDRTFIGNTRPKYMYSVSLNLAWKHLDLTVVGTGNAGYDIILNSPYYQGGWGNNNYSTWIRDRVREGTYPGFSYIKAENNFVVSQYWMADGSFFKIQNVELGYNFVKPGLRVFLRGANLLTISGLRDIDPESPSSGISSYPLFRTFTAGLSFNIK